MHIIEAELGISTADAEHIALRFVDCDLVVTFIDWQERPREITFRDVLAFRWQELDEEAPIRDDSTYEVVDSPWLARQAELQAVHPEDFAHYKLCFNAAGVLDVVATRLAPR